MKKLTTTIAALALLGAAAVASASTVVFEKTGFIAGFNAVNDSFQVSQAGKYVFTLSDLGFPDDFDLLIGAISTTKAVVASIQDAQGTSKTTAAFDLLPGINYFVNIAGDAGGSIDLSLFGAEVTLVPIPAPILLLGSAVAGLVLVGRRRRGARA